MAAVPSVHLLHPVGARLAVRQGDLTQGVCLVVPQQFPVPPDSERDAGHGFMTLPVILDDLQAGQSLILDGVLHAVSGDNGGGIGLRIPLPALRGGQLQNFICPWLEFREGVGAAGVGGAGVDGAALDVLDLHLGPGQAGAGGSVDLLNPEVAVGLILKGHLGGFPVLHGDLLDRLLVQQVILRGHTLIDGVVAHLHQGDGDGTGLRRGVDADGVPVRAHHLKGGPREGHGGTRLILGDLEGGLLRIRFPLWL